jgi:CO dehydrogenase nickel-insertion accessory protein CooC1
VLALDSDLLPGIAVSLGTDEPAEPPLAAAAERDEEGRWRLKRGVGPARAVQRYSTEAPDGVRLLQCGKTPAEGLPAIMPAVQAFYKVVHRLAQGRVLRDWTLVGDLPAGPRQAAFDWAPYAETFLVVVEPTWQGALTARRVAHIATMRSQPRVLAVANKVQGQGDVRLIEERIGGPVAAAVPADPAVVEAERAGDALIDLAPDSPAVAAIQELVDRSPSSGHTG